MVWRDAIGWRMETVASEDQKSDSAALRCCSLLAPKEGVDEVGSQQLCGVGGIVPTVGREGRKEEGKNREQQLLASDRVFFRFGCWANEEKGGGRTWQP